MPRLVNVLLPFLATVCLTTAACSKDEPAPTPTPPLVVPTRGPPTPVPTLPPVLTAADVVTPEWREITEAELPTENWRSVLLEAATGRFYIAGGKPARPNTDGGVSIVGWLPDGEVVIESSVRHEPTREAIGGLYAGSPLGTLRRLTDVYRLESGASRYAISRTGLIAWNAGRENLLIDPRTGQLVAWLPAPPHEIFAWSADGNLLAMQGDDHDTGKFVLVWDRRNGAISRIEEARPTAWSNSGHKLAYSLIEGDPQHPIRVRDFETGADEPVSVGRGVLGWSPNDRYLVFRAEGLYETEIFDMRTRRAVVITASTSGGWVDSQTYYFLGETCEEETLYTVRADGSGLRAIAPLEWIFAEPLLAPDGDTVAFNGIPRDQRWYVKLVSITQAMVISEFPAGPMKLKGLWSPDGRYVVVEVPFGRDACMGPPPPMKTEIRIE